MSVDSCREGPWCREKPRPGTRLRAVLAASVLVSCIGGLACNESQPSQVLRALALSDDISLVCYDLERREGTRIDNCPDRVDDGVVHELLGLVTQTMTGEVTVLNFSSGQVVDVDPATPAPSFLPVGGSPVDIATTPGGTASFVAVAEAGRQGIYALPTSCATTASPKTRQSG